MRKNVAIALILAMALALTACTGPFAWFAGGALEGKVAATPESWVFTDEVDTVQFETRPSDPYSVNIWATAVGPYLYVHAGATRATWVEHMEKDPRVRIKIEETIYELDAVRVEDQDEFDRFSKAYEAKYGWAPRNGSVVEAYLFRLAPRAPRVP